MKNKTTFFTKKRILTILTATVIILLTTAGVLTYANNNTEPLDEPTPKNIVMNLGQYGTYTPILDPNKKQWTIGLWEENAIYPSEKTITDLQEEGGIIIFQMPYNGEINNNGGQIFINDKEWKNGNPVTNNNKRTIYKGQKVEIRYGAQNKSAGFQIWFEK